VALDVQTILVVEDDPMVASCVCEILSELDFAVLGSASSGPEALGLADHVMPDIAVIDVQLTGPMDGIEVAEVLRRRFGTAVIFLSGASDEEMLRRADAAQPVKFLHKPFRPSQLLNAIDIAREPCATVDEIEPF
jgi:DNA-binding NarL/FixJ family response regulator